MKSKEFEKPTLEIIYFNENDDVLTTSGLINGGALDGWGDNNGNEEW